MIVASLPLILISGFLGSAHCVGMCGPFAVMISQDARRPTRFLARQAAFTAGRIFTYTTLGTMAGFAGMRMVRDPDGLGWVASVVAVIAGVWLIREGLHNLGWLPGSSWLSPLHSCLSLASVRQLFGSGELHGVFLAGLVTGFLPCGLVYAFLAIASQAGDALSGGLTMLVFGVGTTPMLLLVGIGGRALPISWRQNMVTVAAFCVIATGCLTIARGVASLQATSASDPACVFDACGGP